MIENNGDPNAQLSRPREAAARLGRVLKSKTFRNKVLASVNKKSCGDYARERGKPSASRRELEDFRSAIRYHWEAGRCAALTPVVLPPKSQPRDRWLTRSEAAKLLLTAWRRRQKFFGKNTDRFVARHVARYILVGLYTGTRQKAICGASLTPKPGRGLIDLERGVFYRKGIGDRATKKRQPAIELPSELVAHVRRWQRRRIIRDAIVEWNGEIVKKMNKAFRSVRADAGFGKDVVPHTLRHTAITWQAQAGVPINDICGYFGITRDMFERVYGHHHPDHQKDARDASKNARAKRREQRAAARLAQDVKVKERCADAGDGEQLIRELPAGYPVNEPGQTRLNVRKPA
jgi:integrase